MRVNVQMKQDAFVPILNTNNTRYQAQCSEDNAPKTPCVACAELIRNVHDNWSTI